MLKKLKDGVVFRLKGMWGEINKLFYPKPQIMSSEDSLRMILDNKCSIARFGDGEFNLILGKSIGFQNFDEKLSKRLKKVLVSHIDNLEIGLPDVFGNLSSYEKKSSRFWKAYMGVNRKKIVQMLDINKIYLNTNMTRFWTGYKDKEQVAIIISLYKRIWKDRDIIFVEGEFTRMGVGNDLFEDAKSTRRILCPARNAWDNYNKILKTILELNFSKEVLFILALGPTATILSYDLTKNGYQALDLGHIDVQYEYYLRKANGKIPLEGKYVNENIAGRVVSDSIIDDDYKNSIITIVET